MLQGGDLQKGGGLGLVLGTKFVMLSQKKKKKEKRILGLMEVETKKVYW
jgi:hypothetical protein